MNATFYDALYAFKDYRAEAARLREIIAQRGSGAPRTLLDVACGTGQHIAQLRESFSCTGLDLDPEMLALARQRNPGVPFEAGDLAAFDLGRRFDVVTCLFGSIGYARTVERLERAVQCMADHLAPGGLLLLEPWLDAESFRPGTVHASLVEGDGFKVTRMLVGHREDEVSRLEMHYLVAQGERIEHEVEQHLLGLFTTKQYRGALEAAGLQVAFEPEGLSDRGLYVGRAG